MVDVGVAVYFEQPGGGPGGIVGLDEHGTIHGCDDSGTDHYWGGAGAIPMAGGAVPGGVGGDVWDFCV